MVALCVLAAAAAAQNPPLYVLSTIAGTGVAGFSGDGGAGTEAQLNQPASIFLRPNGDLYIADTQNYRIRVLSSAQTMSTVVGDGTLGYRGDGGSATAARIGSVYGVTVDSAGAIYIADSSNNVIRKVSGGNISTVAGNGTRGYGGDGGDALKAFLALPTGIAIGPDGAVYFCDTLNHRVRRLGPDGKIATVAGNGDANFDQDGVVATSAALNLPSALAFDAAGNMYIADTFNHRIRKVDTNGVITTVAGGAGYGGGFAGDGGPATSARLNYPRGVAVDAAGRIFIADTFNNHIRVVMEDGRIHTIAGDGRYFDSGDGGLALLGQLRFPRALAVTPQGEILIAETDSSRIRKLTPLSQQPAISRNGVITAAAFGGSHTAAAGSWIEIYGSALGARTREWSEKDFVDGRAPVSLGGTSVTIGGREAFVSYVSPNQVNVQVPSDVLPGVHNLVVHTSQGQSAPYPLTVEASQPGVLAPAAFAIAGRQYAAGVLADGATFALPAGAGLPARAPRPGEPVTFYGVGFGPVAPLLDAGHIARSATALVLPLEVYFGQARAVVTYAGIAPGTLGLYQINVIVPQIEAGDAVPLRFVVAGKAAAQQLYTAVGR